MNRDNQSQLIESLVESTAFPNDNEKPTFDAPWQARMFGMVVAIYENADNFDWRDFQSLLIDEISRNTTFEDDSKLTGETVEWQYYSSWLRAFERTAVGKGWTTDEQVDKRAEEFATGHRTAAEFVEGEHERQPSEDHLHIHR